MWSSVVETIAESSALTTSWDICPLDFIIPGKEEFKQRWFVTLYCHIKFPSALFL